MNFDPRLLALFLILFIALGIFSILTGRRRLRQAQQAQQKTAWYKQISILTGIEYILLALAFLLNIAISYGWIPRSVDSLVLPFYLIVLLASALLAGVVIYQGITSVRRRRTTGIQTVTKQAKTVNSSAAADVEDERDITPEERAKQAQKRRERRHKAALARRRRTGKA
jgi:membrane protein implicated in regulation of membrane protease activity